MIMYSAIDVSINHKEQKKSAKLKQVAYSRDVKTATVCQYHVSLGVRTYIVY